MSIEDREVMDIVRAAAKVVELYEINRELDQHYFAQLKDAVRAFKANGGWRIL